MKRSDFLNAMPPMPDSFVRSMERTLRMKEKYGMRRRHTKRMVLVCALIGALLLAGGALAITRSGLLAQLFGEQTPSEAATELVERVESGAESVGVTATLDEYLYDGETLAVSYTLSAPGDETRLLCNSGFAFGSYTQVVDEHGETVFVQDAWGDPWGLQALGGFVGDAPVDSAVQCGLRANLPPQSQGHVLTLTISAEVYRPLCPLVASDDMADESSLVCMRSVVNDESAHNGAIFDAYARRCEAEGRAWTGEAAALVEAGLIERVGTVSVTRTLTPKSSRAAEAHVLEADGPIVTVLDDCVLTLESLRFTAASAQYCLSVSPRSGALVDSPACRQWMHSGMFDEAGNCLYFNMGGGARILPDGREAYVALYDADPLAKLPSAVVLCPEKADYAWREGDMPADRFDRTRGVRFAIENGALVRPEKSGRAQFADDFTADAPVSARPLTVEPRVYTEKALSKALLGGARFDDVDGGDYRRKDGTTAISGDLRGRFVYRSALLPEAYWTVMMQLQSMRRNLGGTVDGFSADDALTMLDSTFAALGLERGRALYQSAYTADALRDVYVSQRVADNTSWFEGNATSEQIAKWTANAQAEIAADTPPKPGYFLVCALKYDGLECVAEDRLDYEMYDSVPKGSSIAAFVNPDGVLYMETMDSAALYAITARGDAKPPMPLDQAKPVALEYATRYAAIGELEIACARYQYAPVWSDDTPKRLTLVPGWVFYAKRADGALYAVATVT